MRLTAAVALLLLLVGCGDGQPLNVEGSTTTTSAVEASPSTTAPTTTVPPPSVAQPQCVSDLSNDGYDYTADPDKVGAQQEALRGDQEALLAYGAEHPDEYTAVAFNNRPTVILVGYFTGHLDEHRAALRRRLSHPDKFELRQSLQSERDARAMSDAIRDDPKVTGLWNGLDAGNEKGAMQINLVSTRAGKNAAAYIHQRWGDKVCVSIAAHPYPHGAWKDRSVCPESHEASADNPNVDFVLVPNPSSVARGQTGDGVARITNRGTTTLEGITGTAISLSVVKRGTSTVVGGELGGASTDMGRGFKAEPGQTIEIPIRFGTDDCRADSDYSLPAGEYGLTAYVKEFGRSAEAKLTVTEE